MSWHNRNRLIKYPSSLFLLLVLTIQTTHAAWTGTSFSIDEIESDWLFENNQRISETTRLNLHFEESTRSGISVGANIGRLTTRISNASGPRNTEKFDASYFGIFLRYPFTFGEYFGLHNQLGYQFHSGSASDGTTTDQIEWRELNYQLGVSVKLGNLRIMPFATISDVSGDILRESNTETFENEEEVSTGLSLDLFIEPTSFVRLKFTSSGDESFSLRFAREF